MIRRHLTVLAAVPLLALIVGAGSASAAPTHPTVRAEPRVPASMYNLSNFAKPAGTYGDGYVGTWAPDQSYEWKWSGSNQIYNGAVSDGGVRFAFAVDGCAPPPQQGYCELEELNFNAFTGIWYTTGYCAGWSADLQRIVRQGCIGASYQAWAGTGGAPDLIWSYWVEYYYPHVCPIYGGYTQQVITSDTGRGAVYLSCPQAAGGQDYKGTQKWYIVTTPG